MPTRQVKLTDHTLPKENLLLQKPSSPWTIDNMPTTQKPYSDHDNLTWTTEITTGPKKQHLYHRNYTGTIETSQQKKKYCTVCLQAQALIKQICDLKEIFLV